MSEPRKEFYGHLETRKISFAASGLLGAGVNGAAPEVATGIEIDGAIETCPIRENGAATGKKEMVETYWLRVFSGDDVSDAARSSNFLFMGDYRSVETTVATILQVASGNVREASVRNDLNVDAYRNHGQLLFDENADEEAIPASIHVVRSADGDLTISASDRSDERRDSRDRKTVARLQFKVDHAFVARLAGAYANFRLGREEAIQKAQVFLENDKDVQVYRYDSEVPDDCFEASVNDETILIFVDRDDVGTVTVALNRGYEKGSAENEHEERVFASALDAIRAKAAVALNQYESEKLEREDTVVARPAP